LAKYLWSWGRPVSKCLTASRSDLYDKPGHLIRRCHQIAWGLFLERCAEFDLTPAQYALLKAAEAEPGADQITLAGLAALDRSNTARLAGALEARGLLRRAPDPNDRRARRLSLTADGQALLRRAAPAVERVQRELLAPLSGVEERRAFVAALGKIADVHNEISRAPLRLPDTDEAA
jgi:DNA-binding MarR family transcriptional regulator